MHQGIDAGDVIEVVPEEGVFLPMNSLLNAGDHVVVMHPSFQSLWEIARATGCELSFWRQRRTEDGWHFDVDELERLIRPDTRMLIINFPHNPTGYLPGRADFERIVELARRQNLILFSDEIYRFTEHDEALRLPSACELYERAIVLGGLSKCFGLPGLRVGWLITRDAGLSHELQEMKSYTTICGSAPSEILALIALDNWRALTARSREIVQANIGHCREFFGAYPDLFWLSYPERRHDHLGRAESRNAGERIRRSDRRRGRRDGLASRDHALRGQLFPSGLGTDDPAAGAGACRAIH